MLRVNSGSIKVGSLVRVNSPSATDWAGEVGICIELLVDNRFDIRVLLPDNKVCFFNDEVKLLVEGTI